MTSLTAQDLINKWRIKLNLQHWEFGISESLPTEDHDMECWMTPTRQHAAIRIHPKCWAYSDIKFEKLIIHEMLHPIFDPILAENEDQLRLVSYKTFVHKLLQGKHRDKVETTLDHIANIIYDIDGSTEIVKDL